MKLAYSEGEITIQNRILLICSFDDICSNLFVICAYFRPPFFIVMSPSGDSDIVQWKINVKSHFIPQIIIYCILNYATFCIIKPQHLCNGTLYKFISLPRKRFYAISLIVLLVLLWQITFHVIQFVGFPIFRN